MFVSIDQIEEEIPASHGISVYDRDPKLSKHVRHCTLPRCHTTLCPTNISQTSTTIQNMRFELTVRPTKNMLR